jgi:F0F1-type ATP synthase membrane subunit b/b'
MKPAMIRTNSLTLNGPGPKTLDRMEAHGKRLDSFSKARVVRPVDPLVYGSLDLREAYDAHMDGVQVSAGLKRPLLHSIIKFPGDFEISEEHQQLMLDAAVKFVNATHGGDAVFAARLDRDEAGQHNVDVFYAPKFEKITIARKSDTEAGIRRGDKITTTWMSTTRHGKELCEKHRDEIESRNDQGKFSTTPRSVGIALQSELFMFLKSEGLDLAPRTPKSGLTPDWQETDAWKRTQDEKAKAKRIADATENSIRAAHRRADEISETARIQAKAIIDQAHVEADEYREQVRDEVLQEVRSEVAEEIKGLQMALDRIRSQIKDIFAWGMKMLSGHQAEKFIKKLAPIEAEADFVVAHLGDMSPIEDPVEDGPAFG